MQVNKIMYHFLQKLFDRDHIKIDGKDIGLHIKHSNFTYIKQYIKSLEPKWHQDMLLVYKKLKSHFVS